MEGGGEVKTFNADKDIAQQRDLPLVINLMRAFRQARIGETPVKSIYDMTDDEKVFNKVSGLSLVIHSLRDLIVLGWGRTETQCRNKWNVKKPEERGKFEEEENGFNRLMYYRDLLIACQKDIREADLTPSFEDDFMVKKTNNEGVEYCITTKNYEEMLDVLEKAWPPIEMVLHRHKILSQGMMENELLSHEEIASEAEKRVIEA